MAYRWRDEQHEFGITIPFSGWSAEVTTFSTHAHNFFDHDVLGNSNIFFPLTIERARIHGWEVVLGAPRLAGVANLHVAYSHQTVQGKGGVSGGLTDFSPPDDAGWYFLDHDQRNTLSSVVQASLPWRAWLGGTVAYGSGFLDGDGPAHLPAHVTLDFSVGKNVGENVTLQLTALNLTNKRYLIDNSNTFGGTHWNAPRQVSLQVKYRFHY